MSYLGQAIGEGGLIYLGSAKPSTGGGGATINNEDITVTVNGEYTASSGYTGLGTVTVNVPNPSTGTLSISTNGTYDVTNYASANVSVEDIGITREISSGGVYQMPSTNFTFSLPSTATNVGESALQYAFYNNTNLTSVDLSSLTTVSGASAFNYAFRNCTNLTSFDLSSLITVSGNNAFDNAFYNTNLTSISLPSLTTVSGNNALSRFCQNCTNLTSADLSALTTVSSSYGCLSCFYSCTNLTSVDLSSLTTVSGDFALQYMFSVQASYSTNLITSFEFISLSVLTGSYALQYMFQYRKKLKTVSFPSLTTQSFGSNTDQFNRMISGITGCTVHFPSNLQSVIGSWSDVTAGFGGTNTTVLFDLPETS